MTEIKYTFRKIWRRLTPAQQNDIVANNDGDIPIAGIPNLTPTEIFCSLVIEYLIARNFMVSFDNGAT